MAEIIGEIRASVQGYSGKRSVVRALTAPGCLYTVERSILKLPMWVKRNAKIRLWHTCKEPKGLSQRLEEQNRNH